MLRGDTRTAPGAFARLWRVVRPVRWRLVAGMVCAVLASLMALAIPQVLALLVNGALGPNPSARLVWLGALVVFVLGALEAVLVFLRRVFALFPAIGVEKRLRIALFDKLLRLPVAFHDEWGSGQLLSRSMADLGQVRRFVGFATIMLVTNVVMIGAGTVLMAIASPLLALVFVAAAVPLGYSAYRFNRRYTALSRLSQDQSGDLATTIEQSVQGIRVIKAFGRSPEALEGFTDQASELLGTEVNKASAVARFMMNSIMLPELALGVALGIGLFQISSGELTIGQLSAYFATVTLITNPVRMLGNILGMVVTTRTALDRHYEVMDAPITITDPEVSVHLGEARGALALRDVEFRYPDAPDGTPPLLSGLDLDVRPGETMALVGVTGSGKTTLLQLVGRLYDVTGGSISLDGVDVRHLTRDELHAAMSFTFEEPTLFSQSVRDNVLLGAPDGDEDLLEEALTTADADFARHLPEGVDTRIGEEGMSLSGGQRQRLALARAIASRPRVLLLDDPLSALDTRTEQTVTQRLREVLAGTTTLVVAHRASTVALADRVALLDGGRVTAVGTHADLIATNERYRWIIAYLAEEKARNLSLDDLAGRAYS